MFLSFLKLSLSAAPGLMNLIIRLKHDQIRVISHTDGALAVIDAQTAGRVDGAGIDGVIEGNHSLFHQDPQAFVQPQRGACQAACGGQVGASVLIDNDLVSTEDILGSGRRSLCHQGGR